MNLRLWRPRETKRSKKTEKVDADRKKDMLSCFLINFPVAFRAVQVLAGKLLAMLVFFLFLFALGVAAGVVVVSPCSWKVSSFISWDFLWRFCVGVFCGDEGHPAAAVFCWTKCPSLNQCSFRNQILSESDPHLLFKMYAGLDLQAVW